MKIAHIADLHVRFGTRHKEISEVFNRTIEDFKKQKPDRVVIAGDLFHMKINLSPNSIGVVSDFLVRLSEICSVDIIAGNHDTNLQQAEQGDAITPILRLLENGYIITKDMKKIPDVKNSIFFYRDSGFYEINEKVVYGVYSCLDNEIIKLETIDSTKIYIALYHGSMKGARLDNGMLAMGEELIKPSTFNGFHIVMCGDLHECQTIQEYSEEIIEVDFEEKEKYSKKGFI